MPGQSGEHTLGVDQVDQLAHAVQVAGLIEGVDHAAMDVVGKGTVRGSLVDIGLVSRRLAAHLGEPLELAALASVLAQHPPDVGVDAETAGIDTGLLAVAERLLDAVDGVIVQHLAVALRVLM